MTLGALEIPEVIRDAMRGCSWRDDPRCPRFEQLRLLRLRHHTFECAVSTGELVVDAAVADEVVAIFEAIFHAGFPIARMQRIDAFAANDDASMAANNSSGFNFRVVDGTRELSQHALGRAIDINPLQNPWLRGARVDPPAGSAYLDRANVRPGMIVRPGPVVEAFARAGWLWGGDLAQPDYHHFSKPLQL
jgi:hypothetical protein